MNIKMIVIAVIGAVVIGGGSFYAGTKVAGNDSRPGFAQMGQNGQMRSAPNATGGMQGRPGAMGAGTAGEVIAKDDTSITVKLQDGGSKIVFFTPTTPVTKTVPASTADVAVGEQVLVTGSTNADGSVLAQSIRVGEMLPSR